MNKSIKKILYIGLPIIVILIAVSVLFFVKASQFSAISKNTSKSELIAYTIVDDSFKSEETAESTELNKQYQTKIILEIHNMAKYDLGYFDITIEFAEEGTNEIWSYTQEEFSFYADNKLIISKLRPYKAKAINNVYINFIDEDDKVYIYSLDEYNELYGEKNQIISPVTLKVYKTLTLASTIFTVVIAFAIAMLIIVYTRPEEDELLKKVTSRPKKSIDTKEPINNIESTKTIEVQKNTTQRKSASSTSKTTTKKSITTKKQSNKNEK